MTMRPLDCEQRGRRVLIEKFSAAHTSVQWTGEAGRCPVIAAQGRGVGIRNAAAMFCVAGSTARCANTPFRNPEFNCRPVTISRGCTEKRAPGEPATTRAHPA